MLETQEKVLPLKTLNEMAVLLEKDEPLNKNFSNEDLHVLYSLAYSLYQAGDFSQAREIFHQLAYLKPLKQKYWMGLGACFQLERTYDEALKAWSMAAILDEEDSTPHLHAAECYFSMSHIEEGIKALKTAKSLSEKAPKEILDKITGLEACWCLKKQEGV